MATAAIIFAAVAVGVSVLYRTFGKPSRPPITKELHTVPVANWEQLVLSGKTLAGPDAAQVIVIEFTDLECPACRGF